MRRIIAGAAVAIVLLGWAAWARPWAPPVHLLTSATGCYAGGEGGGTDSLLADAQFGTRFGGQPVMWPDGFSARRAGDQVEVLDSSGQVVATTGRLYHISSAEDFGRAAPFGAFPAAAGCGYPWDFVDCGPLAHPFALSDLGKKYCAPNPHALGGVAA